MPHAGCLGRRCEVLHANDVCTRILWLEDLVTKQYTHDKGCMDLPIGVPDRLHVQFLIALGKCGGATQSRTGLDGFAIRCITALLSRQISVICRSCCVAGAITKKGSDELPFFKIGAGNETRTRDLNLGKVALYQLSYSRIISCIQCLLLKLEV